MREKVVSNQVPFDLKSSVCTITPLGHLLDNYRDLEVIMNSVQNKKNRVKKKLGHQGFLKLET